MITEQRVLREVITELSVLLDRLSQLVAPIPTGALADDAPVVRLGLAPGLVRGLRARGVTTVAQLSQLTAEDILDIRAVGKQRLREVQVALTKAGRTLSDGSTR
jgi:DNA-directed RNA polymerase alpha subunit